MASHRLTRAAGRAARISVAHAVPPVSSDRPLWVFGASSGRSYSDNAQVVHAKACQLTDRLAPLWIIDPDSPDRSTVEERSGVALRETLEAHRMARSAQVILFSHGVQDVPGMMWNRRAVRVRLGHGLTAFNRTRGRLPRSVQRMTNAIDLAPVASRMEQDHKAEWGFPRSKLPITGLARWDAMLHEREGGATTRERPLILYAPTSRPWHSARDISSTGRLRPVYQFLHAPRLRAALKAGEFDLAIYFHQVTRYRFGQIDWLPSEAQAITAEAELPRTIAAADLVISDYSSILWDALYLDTPVIFFQFDRSEHESRRGSHIDLGSRLFGPNVATSKQLLDEIDRASDDGFQMLAWKDDREAWQQRAFAFRDANNAQRIIMAVDERLSARSG